MIKSFFITLFFIIQFANAQYIGVSGEWNYSIPTNDITEAGEDFSGTFTSDENQVYLDIWYWGNWSVYVAKNDIDWNDDFKLLIRRTSNGYGNSKKLNGGTNFQEIYDSETRFFKGKNWCYSIPIQFEIRDISVLIPANTYIVEIVYTLQSN